MKVFFYPLILLTLFYVIGLVLGSYLHLSLIISSSIFIATLVCYFILAKIHKTKTIKTTVNIYLIWIALGVLITSFNNPKHYKNHYINQDTQLPKNYTLTIEDKLKSNKKYDKYIAEISFINQESKCGKILLYVPLNKSLKIGDIIFTTAELVDISQPKNPNEFSYSSYLEKQYIYKQSFIKENFIVLGHKKTWNYFIDNIRQGLINSFNIHNFSKETQSFINAFLFGQRNEVSAEMNEDYTKAGVIHILAISGLHIAILYGMLLYIFKALHFGYKQRFIKLIISLVFLWMFAFITGMSASVVRSVMMFSIIAIAMSFDKNQNIYNAMAISFLCLTLWKPNFIYDVGFQLSYLSVFIIIVCAPIYKKCHITKYKIVHFCIDLFTISLSAQLFLLPLILYYFHQFPTLFLIANAIVIPLSNFILYGLVFILILNFIFPSISIFTGKILEFFIELLNKYINWIANFDYSVVKNIPFNQVLLWTSMLVLFVCLKCLFKFNYKNLSHVLLTIVLLQISYLFCINKESKIEEFIIWNTYKNHTISIEKEKSIKLFSNNFEKIDNVEAILENDKFNKPIIKLPKQNFYVFKENTIMVIDQTTYLKNSKANILILTQSPKINLERIISEYNPQIIIADANNYKSYIDLWKKTCLKKNIPFHNTYEMGYYIIP